MPNEIPNLVIRLGKPHSHIIVIILFMKVLSNYVENVAMGQKMQNNFKALRGCTIAMQKTIRQILKFISQNIVLYL